MTGKPRLNDKASFVSNLVIDELEYGVWQDWEEVLHRATPKIPAGSALRTYQQVHAATMERMRARTLKRTPTNYSKSLESKDEKIRSGARTQLNAAMHRLVLRGLVEVARETASPKSKRRVRLKDRRAGICPNCGCNANGEKPETDG